VNAYLGAGAVTANSGSTAIAGTVGASTVSIGGGTLTLSTGGRLSNSAAVTLSSGGLNLGGNETVGTYTQSGGTLAGSGTLTAASYSVSGGTLSATLGGTGTVAMTGGGFLATPGQTTANAVTIGVMTTGTTFGSSTTLAGWDFSGVSNGGTNDMKAGTLAAGVINGTGLTRGAGITVPGSPAARAFGGQGWDSASLATATTGADFVSFTLSGSANTVLTFEQVNPFDYRRSSTGPPNGALQYSTDGVTFTDIKNDVSYASTSSSGASFGSINLSSLGSLSSGTITFRIVNWGASSSAGTWYLYDTVNSAANDFAIIGKVGTIIPVINPATAALGIGSAGATTYSGPIAVTGTAELTAVTGGTATFSGVISGTSGFVIKTGAGTVILNGSNTYGAGTSITAGTLKAGTTSAFGSSGVTLSAGATLDLNNLSFANTITNNGGTLTNAASYSGTTSVSGTADYSGAVGGTVVVGTGGVANFSGAINSLSISTGGQANLNDGASLSQSTLANNGLVTVNQSGNTTLSTAITGSGAFQKLGSGILTVSGNNTYSGATTVSAGGLKVTGSIGGGGLSVAAAAWLMGTGTISGPVTVSGTLTPGSSPGVITLGSLVLTPTSSTVIEIASAGTRGTAYDGVSILTAGGLTYGGTMSIAFGGSAIADNTTFHIFDFTGSALGSLAAVESSGFYAGTWTTQGSGTYQLISGSQTLTFSQTTGDVIVVPEPAAIAVAAIGLGTIGLTLLRRRRA